MHGKMSEITINNKNPLFEGLEDKIYAARYHSLIIDDETFPEELKDYWKKMKRTDHGSMS